MSRSISSRRSGRPTCLRIDAFFVQEFDDAVVTTFISIHLPVAANEKFPLVTACHFDVFYREVKCVSKYRLLSWQRNYRVVSDLGVGGCTRIQQTRQKETADKVGMCRVFAHMLVIKFY